jgi:putative iron-regulated protein
MKKLSALFLLLLISTVFFNSCREEDEIYGFKREALANYADIVRANYEDSYQAALSLKQAIDAFVANPTDANFQACKTLWLASRLPYGQTEAFRFYGGPIDNADGPEGLINAWPIDESFIDYVSGNPDAGLINNPQAQPNINKQILVALNELFSEESIFTGFHAIEFLLWGQDLDDNGPGNRPYTDYIQSGGGTAANQGRRAQYLQVAADLLLDHLAYVRDAWAPGAPYREDLVNRKTSNEALGLLFFGLKEFVGTEMAGERMFVALDTKDQEHEHSCFSDNTVNDHKMNLLGVKNVYFGTYKRTDGSTISGRSFNDIAEKLDKRKAAAVRAAFANAEAKVNALPEPFDYAIVNNQAPVIAAMEAIAALADELESIGRLMGASF